MKFQKIYIASITLALAISGCASNDSIESRIESINEAQQEVAKQRTDQEQERREQEMDTLPDWYLSPPDSDATGFYGVGYARSKHIGHALKSAKLDAEFNLAKMYRQELSGSERAFERGNSDGDVTTQTTFLIDKIIDAVPVVGYSVVEQKMFPVNGVYETYVLLKLPYDEFNKVLQSERARTLDKTVQASFDDLDRRLAERRLQKAQDAEDSHKRELEAMQKRADILEQSSTKAESSSNTSSVQSDTRTEVKTVVPNINGLIR